MDTSSIAAWVAFLIALIALLGTLAQAIQQYVATGQNIRKCDKLVWGPMPGRHGRRIWTWNQFRFRVVFEMPNIFIPTENWEIPGPSRLFPAERVITLGDSFAREMSNDFDEEVALRECSEACWVSFTRQVSHVCPNAVRFGLIMSDVDRWPADLSVVPMQVSLRDIIVLGLMTGMSIMVIDSGARLLEMTGPAGFITSSEHPLLGLLIRFSAFSRAPRSFYKGLRSGELSQTWLARVQGVASVAERSYSHEQRDYHEGLFGNWRTFERRGIQYIAGAKKDVTYLVFEDTKSVRHEVPIDTCSSWNDMINALDEGDIAKVPFIVIGPEGRAVAPKGWERLIKVVRQGHLKVIFKIKKGDYIATEALDLPTVLESTSGAPLEMVQENEAEKEGEQVKEEKKEKVEGEVEEKPKDVKDVKDAQGEKMPLPMRVEGGDTTRLLLDRPWYPQIESDDEGETNNKGKHRASVLDGSSSSSSSLPIRPRITITRARHYMDSYERSEPVSRLGSLSLFWASQVDIELGYWATPWGPYYDECKHEALPAVIDVIFAGLAHSIKLAQPDVVPTEKLSQHIRYVQNIRDEIVLADLWTMLRNGGHTWPPYALNGRGGTLEPEPHMLIDFTVFDSETEKLPPILLLESVRNQHVGRNKAAAQILNQDRTTELASLDHWLSWAAKTNSITNGRLNLVQYAPAMIKDIDMCFGYEFSQLTHLEQGRDGGDVRIRELALKISASLFEVQHSNAEHYFFWVAFLRAIKVKQCIGDGPDTFAARSIFQDDLLVYFA